MNVKSRKTERTLWTLIAVQMEENSSDERARHLKSLWLKLLTGISKAGGIALEVFGMRVTYVNVLQVRLRLKSEWNLLVTTTNELPH